MARGLVRSSGRGAFATTVVAAAVVAAWAASPASAAETTVSFESLSGGTVVTNQLLAQGIQFGHEAEFGQSGKPGDCGAPTVGEEAPYSPPKYALLGVCVSAFNSLGTFGALPNHPRGTLSMQVRDAESSPPELPEVFLKTYDAQGNELAKGQVASTNGGWQALSAVQGGGKNSQISYFSISTPNTIASKVAIRDIKFEAPIEESTGGGGPTPTPGPTPPTPPTASASLTTPNPAPGRLLTISGAASQAGSGRIVSYDWDLNGDGKVDTSTGANPIAHLILAPGAHTIGLTVTNSSGEKSTSKFGLSMPTHIELPPPPDGGQGPCEPTLEVGDAQLIAECIQKLGRRLRDRDQAARAQRHDLRARRRRLRRLQGADDQRHRDRRHAHAAVGSAVSVELLNTPIGDMGWATRPGSRTDQPRNTERAGEFESAALPRPARAPGASGREADEDAADGDRRGETVRRQRKRSKAGCCPPSQKTR